MEVALPNSSNTVPTTLCKSEPELVKVVRPVPRCTTTALRSHRQAELRMSVLDEVRWRVQRKRMTDPLWHKRVSFTEKTQIIVPIIEDGDLALMNPWPRKQASDPGSNPVSGQQRWTGG